MTHAFHRRGLLLLKYALALALLGYVLSNIELGALLGHVHGVHLGWVALAFVLLNLAQIVGSERMRYYYRRAGHTLSAKFCLRLTYVSMVYNMLVPGGVGGDAYRIYFLKKQGNFPVRQGIRLQLANRANGLLALILLMVALAWCIVAPVSRAALLTLSLMAVIATLLGYFLALRRLLREDMRTAAVALLYSFCVQLLTIASAAALAAGFGLEAHYTAYLFIFGAANILGMLPLTVGGLGIRELTFLYGCQWLGLVMDAPLSPEFGVALSLGFFLLTLAMSLLGFFWISALGKHFQSVPRPTET